ncbi:rCG53133, partial [Rattus norvegicus]
QCLPLCVSLL